MLFVSIFVSAPRVNTSLIAVLAGCAAVSLEFRTVTPFGVAVAVSEKFPKLATDNILPS